MDFEYILYEVEQGRARVEGPELRDPEGRLLD